MKKSPVKNVFPPIARNRPYAGKVLYFWIVACFTLSFLVNPWICRAQVSGSGKHRPKKADNLVHVKLQLKWYHQFQFAGYYAAQQKGYYKEAGLDLEIMEGDPRISTPEAVLSGKAQFGVAGSELLLKRIKGKPVVVLAAIFQHSPLVFVSHRDSGITHPQDMIGKRVGVSKSTRDAELLATLQNEGVSIDDILPPVGGKYTPSFYYDGSVDAASAYITNEPYFMEKRNIPYSIIWPITYGIDFYGDCLFTSEEEVKSHPESVRKFREASLMGWEYAMAHPEEIVDVIIDQYGCKKERAHLLYEAEKMQSLILPKLVEMGHMNPGRWRHIGDTFVKLRMAEPGYSVKGFMYTPDSRGNYVLVKRFLFTTSAILLIAAAGVLVLLYFNRRLSLEIRERKEAQEKLKFQAELMDQIQDSIVATDLEGRITYINHAAVRSAGKTRDEFIGKHVHIFGNKWKGEEQIRDNSGYTETPELSPKKDPFQTQIIETTLKKGKWEGRVENYTDEGDIVVYDTRTWLIRDEDGLPLGMVGISTNITEKEKSQHALKESEDRYRIIFNSGTDAFIVFDRDGKIIDANQKACAMYGYSLETFMGLDGKTLFHEDDEEVFEALMRLVQKNRKKHPESKEVEIITFPVEVLHQRINSTSFHVEINASPFDHMGMTQLLLVIRDITERVKIEKHLEEAKNAAEDANRAKSEFIANMSHEIRTPMNAILGFSEILLNELHQKRYQKYLTHIYSSGKTLLNLINDILDLSKIEARKMDIQPEPVDVKHLVEELRSLLLPRLKNREVVFQMDIDDDIPDCLMLDEVRIRQILMNLLGNALKFTHKGRILLRVFAAKNPKDEKVDIVFEVEDTGIGIPGEQLELVFESFQQQKSQKTKQYGGTGLGLTITKKLVEIMQGTISVKSEPEKGSTFQVALRNVEIGKDVQLRSGYYEMPEMQMPVPAFLPASVLVVDDAPFNNELVAEYLADTGLNVIRAINGKNALELMKDDFIPDLILMDIRMPKMDGFEATEIMRSREKTRHIPVIACTAAVLKEEEEKALDLFDGILKKPLKKKKLLLELMRFLPHKERQEEFCSTPLPEAREYSFPKETKKRLPELIIELEKVFLPLSTEILEGFFIDDIEDFATKVKKKGEENRVEPLFRYGTELYECAQNIELEKIEELLLQFETLVRQIKTLNETL